MRLRADVRRLIGEGMEHNYANRYIRRGLFSIWPNESGILWFPRDEVAHSQARGSPHLP